VAKLNDQEASPTASGSGASKGFSMMRRKAAWLLHVLGTTIIHCGLWCGIAVSITGLFRGQVMQIYYRSASTNKFTFRAIKINVDSDSELSSNSK